MIGIYYICTGSYKVWLDGFIKSLDNFRVGREKQVILLTDEIIDVSVYNVNIVQYLISDLPWPIVALLKMWYINKYRGEFDEIYYFNANAQVKSDIPECNGRIMLTRHVHHGDEINDGKYFMKLEDDNPHSLSYIGRHDYTYVMAGFFGGEADLVYDMCEMIASWVEDDLRRCVIPRWHDESYLNKYRTIQSHICDIINVWDYVALVYNEEFKPKRK